MGEILSRAELIERYFNGAAFALPPAGTFGNTGRNLLIGPGSHNLDSSVFRMIPLGERVRMHFRAEFFNTLNHANLGNPVSSVSAVNIGRIQSTSAPRILQFGLRVQF